MTEQQNTSTESPSTDQPGTSRAFELLLEDHREVLERLADARGEVRGADRIRRCEALRAVIAHHLEVEERVLYPQLRTQAGMQAVVKRLVAQHQEIRDASSVLADAAAPGEVHERALTRLAACLERHFTLEESELSSRLAQSTGADDDALALEIEAARSQSRGAYGVG